MTIYIKRLTKVLPTVSVLVKQAKKMGLTEVSSNFCFGGFQKTFSHESSELKCKMQFSVYIPPQVDTNKVPVIYWLSGLECTEQNFPQKAGAQRIASELGILIVCPDTSPRGCNIDGENDSWDFGTGAGFYLNASREPWNKNYRMYSYVTAELPAVITENFPVISTKQSIMGHSMGGHGALICALKNPGKYCSVSAFAPICHPSACPWGRKAFSGYLGGEDGSNWDEWDATKLVAKYDGPPLEIFIDQGMADKFLTVGQLQPEVFVDACKNAEMAVILKKRESYDHGYYFIATFIEEHLKFHARYLKV
ncbi:S-formylglutathione hydrolase-like isoform X1 [Lycorma delicatula]|uniref:S-formylglutathione hydrolase-like isoform X1 n=2 Tax=Lycorma delicatula TaxID=130591 RepID=UPI003F513B58